jgi:hypothetical protein
VEAEWHGEVSADADQQAEIDPFGQLDLLLQEIRQDCPS